MSRTQKIYLVSPREPSGATWLINCFLELGIKTHRVHDNAGLPMWIADGNGNYVLNKDEDILKKWLPVLTEKEKFIFNKKIEVIWTHDFPLKNKYNKNDKIIFFIRDPRDSLYSRYKRENPDFNYEIFLYFIDENSLLDKIDNWCLFNKAWSNFKDKHIIKFEDYKKEPLITLQKAVEFCGLAFSGDILERAVNNSSFEKAKNAENRYRQLNPNDCQIINRSGKSGEWQTNEEIMRLNYIIESKTAYWLDYYGYKRNPGVNNSAIANFSPASKFISFIKNIHLPETCNSTNYDEIKKIMISINNFIFALTPELIARAKIRNYEAEKLLYNIADFANNYSSFAQKSASNSYSLFGDGRFFNLKCIANRLKNEKITRSDWLTIVKAGFNKIAQIIKRVNK